MGRHRCAFTRTYGNAWTMLGAQSRCCEMASCSPIEPHSADEWADSDESCARVRKSARSAIPWVLTARVPLLRLAATTTGRRRGRARALSDARSHASRDLMKWSVNRMEPQQSPVCCTSNASHRKIALHGPWMGRSGWQRRPRGGRRG